MHHPESHTPRHLGLYAVLLAVVFLISGSIVAEEKTAEDPLAEQHKAFLEWETGEWNAVVTMPDPAGGEPQRYAGEQTDRFSGCGQWLVTDLHMVPGKLGEEPPPYEGHGVLGWDPAQKRLTGIWTDSRTDWLAVSEGRVDAEGRVLTLDVEGRDPATGEAQTWQFVTTKVSPDRRRLEVFVPIPGGQRLTAAVIEYTRRSTH